MKEFKNYFIGLDMGTTSVGWAVTDENYEIIKKMVRLSGASAFLMKPRRRRTGGCIALPAGESNEDPGVSICFRSYLPRKSAKRIPVFMND